MDDINSKNTNPQGQTEQPNQYGQYGQYGQIPEPQPELPPIVTPPKKKISLAAVITVLVVIGIVIAAVIPHIAPYKAAREFGKVFINEKDTDKLCELMFPDNIGKNELIQSTMNEEISKDILNIKLLGSKSTFSGVKPGKKIKKDDLKLIQKVYNVYATLIGSKSDIKVEKGYEYEIRFKAGGKKYKTKCMVVKLKGDDWKVILGSLSDLKKQTDIFDNIDI